MAIDIYNSRRTNYFKCKYWLRDESGLNDENELFHNKKPDGIFYAKEVNEISKDTRDFGGVWQVDTIKLTLATSDLVEDLDKNSIVEYCGKTYIVDSVQEEHIHKRNEFSCKDSKITYIALRG